LVLEQILRQQPDNLEVRRKAVQVAIDVAQFGDAIRHLEYLLPLSADKGLLEHQLGWCQEAMGQYESSANSFRRAIAASPKLHESYILLAELLSSRLNEPDEAPKVMNAMIPADPLSGKPSGPVGVSATT
jgi:tetratricopeptide (TPR) repeat protein